MEHICDDGGDATITATADPPLLSPTQARDRLVDAWGVPPSTVGVHQVRAWMKAGDLYLVRLGKRFYVPRADVDRFARERIAPPASSERQAS